MHPVTLLAVFVMIVSVQAVVWTPALLASNDSTGLPFEKYFQFFYALGTHDVAWGDIFNLDSKTLKVFTDKEFYKSDETILVKGSVKPYEEGKTITLAISDEHEKIIFLDYVTPNREGVFSMPIPVEELLFENSDKFTVSIHSGLDETNANFVIVDGGKNISFDKIMQQIINENSDSDSEILSNWKETKITPSEKRISILTSQSSYQGGDIVEISGHIQELAEESFVIMQLIGPENNLLTSEKLQISSENRFLAELSTDNSMWENSGIYTVEVTYGNKLVGKTYFVFDITRDNSFTSE